MAKKLSKKADRIKILNGQLRQWRDQQNGLRKKIEAARAELRALGDNPNKRFDLSPRNEEIYRRIKLGHSLLEIGEEFGLGRERVRQIFQRQEKKLIIQLSTQGNGNKKSTNSRKVKLDVAGDI